MRSWILHAGDPEGEVRLVTFEQAGRRRLGVLDNNSVLDVCESDAELPDDMVGLIALGSVGLDRLALALDEAPRHDINAIRILAPIPQPRKNIMAVGRNYRDHSEEFSKSGFDATEKQVVPDNPVIFSKPPTSVIGPGDPIDSGNDPTHTTDYEGELAVVIGATARHVAREDALRHVFGYTIVNDVTARELQRRHVQWFVGKGVDTFCPMGPVIATLDELPDLEECWLRTWVNGELRQESPVSLVFDVPALVAAISSVITLEPGDVIATGTPLGTGMGREPPVFLRPGDVVTVAVDGIGQLENPVI